MTHAHVDPARGGSAFWRGQLEAVKEGVPLADYAVTLTGLERMEGSGAYLGRCPLPDHEDRTPSFYVYDDGHAHCYGCGFHGDVLDLYQEVEGCELGFAVAGLSVRFGLALGFPERWRAKQARQGAVREAHERVRVEAARRRLFRLWEPYLADIRDDELRAEEAQEVWKGLHLVARLVVDRMMEVSGGR